jgi:hypothetical protein
MSNESVSKTTKLSSSLITVLDDSNVVKSNSNESTHTSSKNETDLTDDKHEASGTKRTFLEVNNVEKYKQFLIKPLETKRLKPSDTLDKVRQFLPMLKESTSKLLDDFKSNPDKLNIENVEDEDGQHIEMNLALVSESESGSEDDDEEDEDDDESNEDENASNKNKLKKYLNLFNEIDGDEDSDDDDDEEDEDSEEDETESLEPNPLDDLQLGFKVKNPNEIRKLKTGLEVHGKKSKRNLIKLIEPEEESNHDEEKDKATPKTSGSCV